MNDVKKIAEKRSAHPSRIPAGIGFESDRQQQKAAVRKRFDALKGTQIRKIAAMSDTGSDGSPKKLRVAAYCRVSTDEIDQVVSIYMQKKMYQEKIKANPEWSYAGTYVDKGFSTTNTNHRPGFLKLIADCHEEKIDMIIVESLDHFTPTPEETIACVEELKALPSAVDVFFMRDGFGSDTILSDAPIVRGWRT